MTDSYNQIFADKTRVLFVFAHPDDAEIMAGGTIARLVNHKKEVCSVKMTLGNKGSRENIISETDLRNERLAEDKNAMNIFGIKEENNIYLGFSDGEVENNLETIEALVKVIRKFKPDIVVTHNPEDVIIRWDEETNWINHRDHRNTAKSVVDASYPYSRDRLFFPQHFVEGLDSHSVSEFLFVDYYDHPDTKAIDVSGFVQTKIDALKAHDSQYGHGIAEEAVEFMTKIDDSDKRYERFRYAKAD